MKVYRPTDRVKVRIDDAQFEISPLTFQQKSDIASCSKMVGGEQQVDIAKSVFLSLKYAVKGISGIEFDDGEKLEYEEGEDGLIKDELVDTLLSADTASKLILFFSQIANGIDDYSIEGVEILNAKKKKKRRK